MSDEEADALGEVELKRLKNLRMFKGKTDEEIREFYRNRNPKPPKPEVQEEDIPTEMLDVLTQDAAYEKNFKTKLKALQSEYGIDMNNSNDVEQLRLLVRQLIQLENVNKMITRLQREEAIDTRTLKNLGDFQRSVTQTVSDVQEKLGIARKLRKEKQVDDVAIFIGDLKARAKEFFERKTVSVWCDKDKIQLAQYWLNFPETTKTVHMEIVCWKCKEEVIYTV